MRLASGAATLLWLSRGQSLTRPRWNALWLFLYAATFSYTYLVLGAAMGALLLFFAVQWTMLLGAVRRGERPTVSHFLGGLLALSGLHTLVALRLHTPAPWAVIGMLIAGSAWGLYSMPGRDRGNPLAQTTSNFVYAALLALGLGAIRFLSGVAPRPIHPLGLAEAIVSGAVTSALVYLLWYALLPRLATVVAATIQLAVPGGDRGLGRLALSARGPHGSLRAGRESCSRRCCTHNAPERDDSGLFSYARAKRGRIVCGTRRGRDTTSARRRPE